MPPIEGFISSPTLEEKIFVKDNQQAHFRVYDLDINFKGNKTGGNVSIKYGSQPKPKMINVNQGETIEKKPKVIAKGGVVEEIKIRISGI